jgi:hypothetical protein
LTDNQKNNVPERFVIVAFAFLLATILAIAGILGLLGLEQLNRVHPLANFSGEAMIVGRLAVTEDNAFLPWEESYKVQLETLEGANGWITISKGDYYRLQSESFTCIDRMKLLYECPKHWERWPDFLRDRK